MSSRTQPQRIGYRLMQRTSVINLVHSYYDTCGRTQGACKLLVKSEWCLRSALPVRLDFRDHINPALYRRSANQPGCPTNILLSFFSLLQLVEDNPPGARLPGKEHRRRMDMENL